MDEAWMAAGRALEDAYRGGTLGGMDPDEFADLALTAIPGESPGSAEAFNALLGEYASAMVLAAAERVTAHSSDVEDEYHAVNRAGVMRSNGLSDVEMAVMEQAAADGDPSGLEVARARYVSSM